MFMTLSLKAVAAALTGVLSFSTPSSMAAAMLPSTSNPTGGCYTTVCAPAGTEMSYVGGPVLTHPTVYLVRFSASRHGLVPASGYVPGAFSSTAPNAASTAMAALNGSYADVLREYARPGAYRGATYGGTLTVYAPNIAGRPRVADAQIQAALRPVMQRVPAGRQPIFVVFTPAHQVVSDAGTNSVLGFCAYHGSAVLSSGSAAAYVVIPNESADPTCNDAPVSQPSPLVQMGPQLSHELVETVTDPFPVPGWIESTSGDEIADICQTGTPSALPTQYRGQTYYLAAVYSNVAGACVAGAQPVALQVSQSGSTVTVVTDSASGPVLNQRLTVSGAGAKKTVSTAEGSTSFTWSNPGPLTISFAPVGPFLGATATIVPTASASTITTSVTAPTLSGDTLTGSASVSAVLTASGTPVAGAALALVASGTVIALSTTDATGTANFAIAPQIPLGLALQVVYAGSPGAAPAVATTQVNVGIPVQITTPSTPVTVAGLAPVQVTVPAALSGVNVYIDTTCLVTAGWVNTSGVYSTLVAIVNPGVTTYYAVLVMGQWRVVVPFTMTLQP